MTPTLVRAAEAALRAALEPALALYPEGPQMTIAAQASLHGNLAACSTVDTDGLTGRSAQVRLKQSKSASWEV